MKKKTIVSLRMEFIAAGEKIGFPRLSRGPGLRRVPAGEKAWMAFAETTSVRTLAPALRNARILADYYVAPVDVHYGELAASFRARPRVERDDAGLDDIYAAPKPVQVSDDVKARRIAGLAKARAIKAAKKAEAVA